MFFTHIPYEPEWWRMFHSWYRLSTKVIPSAAEEPVWAIGTGVVATPLQAQDTQYQAVGSCGQVSRLEAQDSRVSKRNFSFLSDNLTHGLAVLYFILHDCNSQIKWVEAAKWIKWGDCDWLQIQVIEPTSKEAYPQSELTCHNLKWTLPATRFSVWRLTFHLGCWNWTSAWWIGTRSQWADAVVCWNRDLCEFANGFLFGLVVQGCMSDARV